MDIKKKLRRWFRKNGWIAAVDAALTLAVLAGFAYVHHGMVRTEAGPRLVSCRSGVTYKLEEGFETAFEGGDAGRFEFEGVFTSGPRRAEGRYSDAGCSVTISEFEAETGKVQVADVYVADIARLQTVMANDAYGKGQREDPAAMTARSGAVFSITGDNYSERYGGVVMRNGVLYSDDIDSDICVLNWDGSMELYRMRDYDLPEIMEKGAYQIWSFGPILLEDGEIPAQYITDMLRPCRRAAIGYYEPGHYCFVIMDGDVSLKALSAQMQALGCESAYALYGGRLAQMNYDGATVSTYQEVSRECSDIIMITE